jgi:glycosyltransferase involved in cell wall biosynthesis
MKHAESQKKALVYCYYLDGHRQVWCAGLADFFLTKGFKVFLVTHGFKSTEYLENGESRILSRFLAQEDFKMLNTEEWSATSGHGEIRAIRQVQRKLSIDVTFIIEGETLLRQLQSYLFLPGRVFYGKTYALITIHAPFLYLPPLSLSPRDLLRLVRVRLRRRLFLKNGRFFSGCYFENEFFISEEGEKRFFFLPDLIEYTTSASDPGSDAESGRILTDYNRFLGRHRTKDVVFFFGQESLRRGSDFLLRLVVENPSLVYVHLGPLHQAEDARDDLTRFKQILQSEDRIFEICKFTSNELLIDTFFSSAHYLLLPYKDFYASSGVMIQALKYGKPVLVPDVGLMRERVKAYDLGECYDHGSYESFVVGFKKIRVNYRVFHDSIREYYLKTFTKDMIMRSLDRIAY